MLTSMELRDAVAIASAVFGLTSGWYFCREAFMSSAAAIRKQAAPTWADDDGRRAPDLAQRAGDAFAGGVLLGLTFALQLAEKLVPDGPISGWVTVAVAVLAVGAAGGIGSIASSWRTSQLLAAP